MTAPRASFLSVVALVDNDAPRLEAFVAEVLAVLTATAADHELILVDDGSADASARACAAILARHECVRVLRLSRRHGPDVAVTAGLDSALGDMTVVMAVATDPPARIPDLVALAAGGADIVIGTTGARGRSLPRRVAWKLFHHVFRRATGFHLVRGASTVASKLGIAPIVIGLTVVAFGTSAPELAVSVNGALTGNADVALGNVIGSNTFNILLILGLSAAISGLSIEQRLLRFDIPLLIVISFITYGFLLNDVVGRLEGVALS